jgi:hypothetical protein
LGRQRSHQIQHLKTPEVKVFISVQKLSRHKSKPIAKQLDFVQVVAVSVPVLSDDPRGVASDICACDDGSWFKSAIEPIAFNNSGKDDTCLEGMS